MVQISENQEKITAIPVASKYSPIVDPGSQSRTTHQAGYPFVLGTVGEIKHLHQTVGNRAVQRMLDAEREQPDRTMQYRSKISDINNFGLSPANRTGLPDHLKVGLECLSGFDLAPVRVHYNSDKPFQIGALAYTRGTDIFIGPEQEKHLPHEGWHVVQQMQGRVRPSFQLKGMVVNDDAGLEREAEEMGKRAQQTMGKKNELTLIPVTRNLAPGPIQRVVTQIGDLFISDFDELKNKTFRSRRAAEEEEQRVCEQRAAPETQRISTKTKTQTNARVVKPLAPSSKNIPPHQQPLPPPPPPRPEPDLLSPQQSLVVGEYYEATTGKLNEPIDESITVTLEEKERKSPGLLFHYDDGKDYWIAMKHVEESDSGIKKVVKQAKFWPKDSSQEPDFSHPKKLPIEILPENIEYLAQVKRFQFIYNGKKYWVYKFNANEKGVYRTITDKLFDGDPKPEDIKQGNIGDCYLQAVLINIAQNNPGHIRQMMLERGENVTVYFFHNGTREGITVRKSLPYFDGTPLYNSGTVWVRILQKAFAVFAEKYGKYGDMSKPRHPYWNKASGYQTIDGGGISNQLYPVFYGPKCLEQKIIPGSYESDKSLIESNGEIIKKLFVFKNSQSVSEVAQILHLSGYIDPGILAERMIILCEKISSKMEPYYLLQEFLNNFRSINKLKEVEGEWEKKIAELMSDHGSRMFQDAEKLITAIDKWLETSVIQDRPDFESLKKMILVLKDSCSESGTQKQPMGEPQEIIELCDKVSEKNLKYPELGKFLKNLYIAKVDIQGLPSNFEERKIKIKELMEEAGSFREMVQAAKGLIPKISEWSPESNQSDQDFAMLQELIFDLQNIGIDCGAPEQFIYTLHAYSIVDVDLRTNLNVAITDQVEIKNLDLLKSTVTLRNPHHRNSPSFGTVRLLNSPDDDGLFTISLAQFLRNFTHLDYGLVKST